MVLCGYIILIYPKVKVYTNFQFIYLMGKGILWFFSPIKQGLGKHNL